MAPNSTPPTCCNESQSPTGGPTTSGTACFPHPSTALSLPEDRTSAGASSRPDVSRNVVFFINLHLNYNTIGGPSSVNIT